MRWIKTKQTELSDLSASFSFGLRADSFALHAGFPALQFAGKKSPGKQNRRKLFQVMATVAAMAASVATFAQTPPAASRFVVVLDAAHGGDDAGAHLGSEAEKAYTLAF